ncbi:MAG: prevent-host-death family protein [Symploca sp. SIO2D2]|nr:prevent-host-death family protein [Symploca sp. SIO2D2]
MLITSEASYSWTRQHLAELMDKILEENSVAIITRRGKEPVAMLPAEELSSILETLHLLRSPANAQRLFSALARAEAGKGTPESLEELQAKIEKACEQAQERIPGEA